MEQKFKLTKTFIIAALVLILIGIATFVIGFIYNPDKTWGNYLLNNFYFMSLAIGGTFWLALQRISQSGWSAAYLRIPEAFANYIPIGAVMFLFMWIGFHHLYEWTHVDHVNNDSILLYKKPWLNIPFFMIRMLIYLLVWIIMTQIMRRLSLKEDEIGGTIMFKRNEFNSKVYIFVLAITFSLASFDWIMTIDPHWYSTIFSLKNFVAAFYHGTAVIILGVIILNKVGYYKFLNKSHLIDFSKYLFILSIVWGYFWFSQYLLMWYANIPEETIYYVERIEGPWAPVFWLDIILNTAVPFVFLLSNFLARSKTILVIVILLLMIGQWTDEYLQIMPGAVGQHEIGFIEIGAFLGYLGLFALITAWTLSKHPLVPKNHPYLEESVKHHLHEV